MGKTTLIRDFAKTYIHAIMPNMEKPADRWYFQYFEDIQTILEALFLTHNIPLSAVVDTLLLIDEIQESPKAIKLLRYFYEEIPELYVISADLCWSSPCKKVENFPVGRVEFLLVSLEFPGISGSH